ncbi:hypothetical protein F2P56_022159 [Juglans regia]|uniref:Transmembrane protein n=1 Tax=Juglans regia TaxID=51240 RepID=A0A833UQ85_JUGRE|nr:hypothetical protein F2P56_022159 [Juglans regia]
MAYKFPHLEPLIPPYRSRISDFYPNPSFLFLFFVSHRVIIMSSIGFSCAAVYVMKKRQEEKLKRMEEKERVKRSGEKRGEDGKLAVDGSTVGRREKVHPGHFPVSQDSAGKPGWR